MKVHHPISHLVRAPFWKRFVAAAIDVIFLALLIIASGFVISFIFPMIPSGFKLPGLLVLGSTLLLGLFLYEPILLSSRGGTLGMMMMHIWVLSEEGETISFWRALLRSVARFVSGGILNLGFFWILWDKNNQAWHDKIAGTFVIESDEMNQVLTGHTAPVSGRDLAAATIFALFTLWGITSRVQKISKNPELGTNLKKMEEKLSATPTPVGQMRMKRSFPIESPKPRYN